MNQLSRLSLLAALAVVATGCGGVVERLSQEPTDGPDGSTGDGAGGSSEPGAGGTDPGGAGGLGEGGAGGAGSGGAGAGGAGTGGGAASTFCPGTPFTGGDHDAVGVSYGKEAAFLLFRDGRTVALDLPDETPPEGAVPIHQVLADARGVVITRGWIESFSPSLAHSVIRWFDRTGAVVDELVSDGQWAIATTADGTTILFANDHVARGPDGAMRSLPDFDLRGAPLPSGWLAGFDPSRGRHVFLHPQTLERREVLDTFVYPQRFTEGFIDLVAGATFPSLVRSTPDGVASNPLQALAGRDHHSLRLHVTEGPALERWALIDDNAGGRWRVDLATGQVAVVPVDLPPGVTLLADACAPLDLKPASSGEVMGALRSGGDAQASLLDVATGAWRSIGLPFAQPGTFDLVETAGTFFIGAGSADESFCPIVGWDAPASAEAIPTGGLQIVRPSAGATWIIDGVSPLWVSPTQDGTCVTFPNVHGDDAERTILDVVGGGTVEIPGTSFIWLE